MNRIVHTLGALAALFSFSACDMTPQAPYRAALITETKLGDNGLVYPTDYTDCILQVATKNAPKGTIVAPPNPPLPKNVPHSTWYNTDAPPARFQKDTTTTVFFQNPNILNRNAGYKGRPICNQTVFAQTYPDSKRMYLPNPCTYPKSDAYARLVCHEMGHLNGWPAYHGD